MDAFLIRHPRISEHAAIVELWMLSWNSTGLGHSGDLSLNKLCEKFEFETKNNWNIFVALSGGQIIGMLALKPAETKLDQLFIHPKYQRQGFGQRLLAFAKNKFPSGFWLKVHEHNHEAIRFYLREGFKPKKSGVGADFDGNGAILSWQP